MKTTKSLSIALERAAALLPGGTVEAPGNGKRRIRFDRDGRPPILEEGTIARCLYLALFTAVLRPELGGLGLPLEEVRDRIRLRRQGIPTKGMGAHEQKLFEDISLEV